MEASFEEVIEKEAQEAYQRGFEEGKKGGYQEALVEAAGFFSLVQKVTDKVLEQREQVLTHLKPDIVEFAISVAEQIIRQELANPSTLVKLIDSLLAAALPVLAGDNIKIYLAPDDLLMLEKHLNKIAYDKKEVKGLRFLPDPFILRGDVRIEATKGLLNGVISRELDDLRSKVLYSLDAS